MMNTIITKKEVLEYAQMYGNEYGLSLLLLFGPDHFDGTWQEYKDLEEALEQ